MFVVAVQNLIWKYISRLTTCLVKRDKETYAVLIVMGSTQLPNIAIDLDEDNLNYANIVNGSQGSIQRSVGVSTEKKAPKRAKRAKNFSIGEDILLVSGWLNTSLDPLIGNDQKGVAYWKRIWEYFHAEKSFELKCDRSQGSLMHRWSGIQIDVNKFCGFYAEVERTRENGTIEQDKILEAKKKFREDRGHSFTYEHCWNLLKHHPKWSLELSRKIPKKGHTMHPTTPAILSDVPDKIDLVDSDVQGDVSTFLERTMGKKPAKTMERKSKSKENAEATQMELKDYFVVLLENVHKEHEQFQLMYDAEQENIKLRKQELELQLRKEDNAIMLIDTSTLEPARAEYFKGLQQDIISKRAAY